ncbi:hypothetical protein GPALN_007746 [Globodera pallida]|nr:hypothetical protein GPALN_007746 [Globodera pallida]
MARFYDKWMCCCGCHVTEGAYKMAWIFTILNILGSLITLLSFISTGLNAKIVYKVVRILMFKSPESIYVMFGLSLKEYEQLVGYSTGEFALFVLLVIAFIAFWCWVYSIVFRAYKFTKQIGDGGTSNETKMPI